jgi:26-hydroxylase
MDPNLWDEPKKFNPSRFIDENGKIRRPEYFMPFGVGRRMCLGDILARMEMFMFFSCIMHQYDIVLREGDPLPSLEGIVGATISPMEFRVKFVPRSAPAPQAPVTLADHLLLRHVGAH